MKKEIKIVPAEYGPAGIYIVEGDKNLRLYPDGRDEYYKKLTLLHRNNSVLYGAQAQKRKRIFDLVYDLIELTGIEGGD